MLSIIVCGFFIYIVIAIIQTVIYTIGMAHAAPLLGIEKDCNYTEGVNFKLHDMYVWLIVIGALFWATMIIQQFKGKKENKENNNNNGRSNDDNNTHVHPIIGLIQPVLFGFSIYGMIQVFNPNIFDPLKECDPYGSNLMYIITILTLCVSSLTFVMFCCAFCFIASAATNSQFSYNNSNTFRPSPFSSSSMAMT